MYSIAQLKPGVAIIHEGEPFVITKAEFSKQARQGGTMKTTMRNLKTGANIQYTFGGSDKAEPADLVRARCQYLYDDGTKCHFMHNETFEQFEIDDDLLVDKKQFLLEGENADILFFEEKPIGVDLPPKVVLKVVETPPGVKGDTAQGGSKPAKLETGATIQVPLFINEGDKIRVNTEQGTYVERA
ncbi:elongation factor P [Patescibacteria group bacterium]|nr:elongation factor P [Patescibacteria group bacterium]